MITVLLETFQYLGNGTKFFETVCVKILNTRPSTTCAKLTRICWFILHDFSTSGPQILYKLAFIYNTEGFCSDQNQKATVWKIAINSYRALVPNSKARAHRSHISSRKSDDQVLRVSITYEISLYWLIRPIMVLSVSIHRVPMIVYAYKLSARKTLLLMNGEIYNIYGLHQL